ncbi:unnamed protein product [Macrosiphum euphorbiae]|uniref:Uncharacterized protein n=1 Tax=Macrosiphum euphorbiae TaxID=13131 RepID=A0AAV0XPH8_9HEMI|nr:unnamed protein product [Macrosiphum euphorbiae]
MKRHIGIKHRQLLRRPVKESLNGMRQIFGQESRRSVSLVPMAVIKDQVGPYWDDVRDRDTDIVDIRIFPVSNCSFDILFSNSGVSGKVNPDDGVMKK